MVDHARQAGVALALVEGEAGVGKSRLVAEVAAKARDEGFAIFAASARPLEHERPFGLFRDALGIRHSANGERQRRIHDLLTRSVKPSDPSQTGQPTDLQFQISDEIVVSLEELAAREPVALVLEDLQWADAASLVTLSALVRHLESSAVLVLSTMRPGVSSATVGAVIEELRKHRFVHLRLNPLSDNILIELVEGITGRAAGPRLRDQLRRCSGNPLFAVELIEALNEEGSLVVDPASVESRASTLPSNLRLIVLRRLSVLPKQTRGMLDVAAVLGVEFSLNDLALVNERSVTDVYRSLQSAVDAGLIEDAGSSHPTEAKLRFRHPLIWEALYEDRPSAARAMAHGQIARALAAAAAPLEQIARHYALGGRRGDQEAIRWLHKAGRHLGSRSTQAAVHFLRRGLNLADDDSVRTAIAGDLAPLLALMGLFDEAEELTRDVLAHAQDPVVTIKLQAGLAHVLVRRGRWHAALEQLEAAASRLPAPFDAFALAPASLIRLVTGDVSRAAEDAAAALASAGQLDNGVVEATSLMTLTWVQAARGEVRQAIATATEAVGAARRSRATFSGFLFPRLMLGGVQLQVDQIDEAETSFRGAIEEAKAMESSISLPYLHSGITLVHFYAGRWDDALSEAETTLQLVDSTGVRWNLLVLGIRARIFFARSEFETAASCLQGLQKEVEDHGAIIGAHYAAWNNALLLRMQGNLRDAAMAARAAWDCLPELTHLFGNRTLVMDLVEVALAANSFDLVDKISRTISQVAAREDTSSARGVAAWCEGSAESDGDVLTRAIDAFRDSGRPYEVARACEAAGTAYASKRDGVRAVPLLHEASNIFSRLGASTDEARTGTKLAELGERPAARRRRARSGSGWSALTPTELKVVRCVTQGMSNAGIADELVISRHTVETHMKHIFVKLHLTSRTQLAIEGAKRLSDGAPPI